MRFGSLGSIGSGDLKLTSLLRPGSPRSTDPPQDGPSRAADAPKLHPTRKLQRGVSRVKRAYRAARTIDPKHLKLEVRESSSDLAIEPRGSIPVYDEKDYDDALKSEIDPETGKKFLPALFGDISVKDTGFERDDIEFLQKLKQHRQELRGHKPHRGSSVTAISIVRKEEARESSAYTAVSDWIVSGGADGSIAVHDMATGQLHCARDGAHGVTSVLCVAVTPGELGGGKQLVLSGGMDGVLRCWSLDDLAPLGVAHESASVHGGVVMCIALGDALQRAQSAQPALGAREGGPRAQSAQQVFSTGRDGRVIAWKLQPPRPSGGHCLERLYHCRVAKGVYITSLAWMPGSAWASATWRQHDEDQPSSLGSAVAQGRLIAGDSAGRVLTWSLHDMERAKIEGEGDEGGVAELAIKELTRKVDNYNYYKSDDGVRALCATPSGGIVTGDDVGTLTAWRLMRRPRPDRRPKEHPHAGLRSERAHAARVPISEWEIIRRSGRPLAHGHIQHLHPAARPPTTPQLKERLRTSFSKPTAAEVVREASAQADEVIAHAIFALACSADGVLLVSGGNDGVIRRWSYDTAAREVATVLHAARGFEGDLPTKQHSESTVHKLASTSVAVDSVALEKHMVKFRPDVDSMSEWIAWGQDSTLLSEQGSVSAIAVWASGGEPEEAERHAGMIFTCGTDGTIKQWAIADGPSPRLRLVDRVFCPLPLHVPRVAKLAPGQRPAEVISPRCAAFMPDGSALFTGNEDGSVYRFRREARGGDEKPDLKLAPQPTVISFKAHGGPERGRALPPLAMIVHPRGWGSAGREVPVLISSADGLPAAGDAGGTPNGSLVLWDARTLTQLPERAVVEGGALHAMALVSDPQLAARGHEIMVAAGPARPTAASLSVWRLRFSRSAGQNGAGRALELERLFEFRDAHGGSDVKCVSVSPLDEVPLEDAAPAHRAAAASVAEGSAAPGFNPPRHLVLSGGADGNVRLWDLLHDQQAGWTLKRRTQSIQAAHTALDVNCLGFAPTSHQGGVQQIISGGSDGALRTWPLEWCARNGSSIRRFDPPLEHDASAQHGDEPGAAEGAAEDEAETHKEKIETLFLGSGPLESDGGGGGGGGGAAGRGGEASAGQRAPRARPRMARAAFELRWGREQLERWLNEQQPPRPSSRSHEHEASAGAPGGGGPLARSAEDEEEEDTRPRPSVPPFSVEDLSTDHWWAELTPLWGTRLASNAHALVMRAIDSRNHRVLRQLLCVNAACDWGQPFLLVEPRDGGRHGCAALKLAVQRKDRPSVQLLLSYMVSLKNKSHSLSSALHVTDLLLLQRTYPFLLATFLDELGLERAHPALWPGEAHEMDQWWVLRSARSISRTLDAALELLGVAACVPRRSFLTRTGALRDPPRQWAVQRVDEAEGDQRASTPVRALRVGIADALACRELLPLLVASSASEQLLRAPAVVALIDAKWHAYACKFWLIEYCFVWLYIWAYLCFLVLSVFRDREEVLLFRRVFMLRHVEDAATFSAKLTVGLNSLLLVRELTLWRLWTRETGSVRSYLFADPTSVFNWLLVGATTVAATLYLQCNGENDRLPMPASCVVINGDGHHPNTSPAAAAGVVMLGFRFLGVVRVLPGMAEIVNMVIRVFRELYHFVLVMLLIIFSFGLALFVRLSEPSRQWWEDRNDPRPCEWQVARLPNGTLDAPICEATDDFSNLNSVLLSAWGMLLGEFDLDNFEGDAIDMALFFGFTFLISVLMLNLIIAVIAEHHRRVMTRGTSAWREALASTIATVDLLQMWWTTAYNPPRPADDEGKQPQQQQTPAQPTALGALGAQHVLWRRLPIDDEQREGWAEADSEQDLPPALQAGIVIGTLLGGAMGAASGATVGRSVGARSTGVAIAMPVAFISAVLVHEAAQRLVSRCLSAERAGAQAALPALGRQQTEWLRQARAFAVRAPVACDISLMVTSMAGLLGAGLGFDISLHLPDLVAREGAAVDMLLGAAIAALTALGVRALGMTARTTFSCVSTGLQLMLAISIGVGAGAIAGFFRAKNAALEERAHIGDGAHIGAHVMCALYVARAAGGRWGLAAVLCVSGALLAVALPAAGERHRWREQEFGPSARAMLLAPIIGLSLFVLASVCVAAMDALTRSAGRRRTISATELALSAKGDVRKRVAERWLFYAAHCLLIAAGASAGVMLAPRLGASLSYVDDARMLVPALAGMSIIAAALVCALAVKLLLQRCGWDFTTPMPPSCQRWVYVLEDMRSTTLARRRTPSPWPRLGRDHGRPAAQ